jgi:hypothetical protein
MSTKKKVQFSEKKTVHQTDQIDQPESGSDNTDQEENYSDSEEVDPKKAKHSLDSDEEDNTDKYKVLKRSALNGSI